MAGKWDRGSSLEAVGDVKDLSLWSGANTAPATPLHGGQYAAQNHCPPESEAETVSATPLHEGQRAAQNHTLFARMGACVQKEYSSQNQAGADDGPGAAIRGACAEAQAGGWVLDRTDFLLGREWRGVMVGKGSVGNVYKVRHLTKRRDVAFKVEPAAPFTLEYRHLEALRQDLTMDWMRDNRIVQDLCHEAGMLMKLGQHPNIVEMIGILIADDDSTDFGAPILVTEYMAGGSLDVILATCRNGSPCRPSKKLSLRWCTQLCKALAFLHELPCPILHRDVKVGNLLVSGDLKHLKLADFGLCRQVPEDDGESDARFMTGKTGTFTHMAPEVFLEQHYTVSADIFSASICMVNMICGQEPYATEKLAFAGPAQLAEHVSVQRYRISLHDKVPNIEMQLLIARMWAHAPADRPGAAECAELVAAAHRTYMARHRRPSAVFRRAVSSSWQTSVRTLKHLRSSNLASDIDGVLRGRDTSRSPAIHQRSSPKGKSLWPFASASPQSWKQSWKLGGDFPVHSASPEWSRGASSSPITPERCFSVPLQNDSASASDPFSGRSEDGSERSRDSRHSSSSLFAHSFSLSSSHFLARSFDAIGRQLSGPSRRNSPVP